MEKRNPILVWFTWYLIGNMLLTCKVSNAYFKRDTIEGCRMKSSSVVHHASIPCNNGGMSLTTLEVIV